MALGTPRHVVNALAMLSLLGACGGKVTVDAASGAGGATAGSTSVATGSSTATGGGMFNACSQPGSCTLVAKTCCGVCGAPMLSDVVGVGIGQESGYRESVCSPNPAPCPACAEQPNWNLFSVCDVAASTCVAVDVAASPYSECAAASDCTLRRGLACCTCSFAGGDWVAVAKEKLGALSAAVCAPDQACDACEPAPPPELVPACVNGHCLVTQSGAP